MARRKYNIWGKGTKEPTCSTCGHPQRAHRIIEGVYESPLVLASCLVEMYVYEGDKVTYTYPCQCKGFKA